jgi:hypothetical protein
MDRNEMLHMVTEIRKIHLPLRCQTPENLVDKACNVAFGPEPLI